MWAGKCWNEVMEFALHTYLICWDEIIAWGYGGEAPMVVWGIGVFL